MRPLGWPRAAEAARDLKCSLKRELYGELHLPRIAGVLDLAKISSVTDIAIGVQELGMVKDVEELGSELEVLRLSHRQNLLDGEVKVPDPRPAANGTG
jgi:hypothetical protein